MSRTPQEIFQHHAAALVAGDVEEVAADYTDDAVLITPHGVLHGRAGAHEAFTVLLGELGEVTLDVPTQVFADDVLYIEWTAQSPRTRVTDGVDTFVFSDDGIRVQTVHCTIEHPGEA